MKYYDDFVWNDEKDDTRSVAVVCAAVAIGLAALVVGVVCTVVSMIEGVAHNHYRVIAVVDYPAVRAIGNEDVFSNTEPRRYGSLISDDRSEVGYVPDVYDGEAVADSEEGYRESVIRALRKEFVRYRDKGDDKAAEMVEKLAKQYMRLECA